MLRDGLEAAGKDYDAFPKVGGIQAAFTADDKPADLTASMASISAKAWCNSAGHSRP